MRRNRIIAAGVLGVSGVGIVSLVATLPASQTATAHSAPPGSPEPVNPSPISPSDAASTVGLYAESLAVGQFTVEDFETMMARLADASALMQFFCIQMAPDVADLSFVDDETASDLSGFVELGPETTTVMAATRGALLDVAVEGFSPTKVALLMACLTSAGHRVPLEYRGTDRSAEEWDAIAAACRARARATRLGKPLAAEHADLLAAVEAEENVIEAAAAIPMALLQLGPHVDAVADPS